jgi:hypothetical protein
MRGPEEADVTPFDLELDTELEAAFCAVTAKVSLVLLVRVEAIIGLPVPVATTDPEFDMTV